MSYSKKHISKREERLEKRQRRKTQILSFVLAFLMVASLGGIALYGSSPQGNEYAYNDYSFEYGFSDDLGIATFTTEVGDKEVEFYSLPQESAYLTEIGQLHDLFEQAQAIIVSSDPDDLVAPIADYTRFRLVQQANQYPLIGAGTLVEVNASQFPVITCENSTMEVPVITFTQANETEVTIEENACVVVQTRPEQSLRVSDHLLYSFLGIYDEE